MALVKGVEYADAAPEVKAVYDDIMVTRKVASINNFWKILAVDPATLKRTWEEVRDVMAPGTIDGLTKELIYIAISATNNCEYCSHSHTASARKQGMSDAMLAEVLAVTALANKTNRLANGFRVDVDEAFKPNFD